MYFPAILLPLLAVVAHAAPAPAVTTTAASTTTAAPAVKAATSDVNTACAAQPTGISMAPTTDTAAAFTKYTGFHGTAVSAAMVDGYLINFSGSNKAVQQPSAFMTYYQLNSYNPQTCADYCTNTYGCTGFNIFFERAPLLNPAAGCPNPPSTTYVKCSLFGQSISTSQYATNAGQWRGPYTGANVTSNFQVVIAGSNAYSKNS